MKITDCIQKQKENRSLKKRENIELLKPIVNIFLGGFSDKEAFALVDLLDRRIGDSDKVNYASFNIENKDGIALKKVKALPVFDVQSTGEGIERRRVFSESVQNSKELEIVLSDYASEIFNKVARYSYQLKGIIRINILFKAEDLQSVALERVIVLLKQKFGIIYTEGVYIDSYCILDQREYSHSQRSDERKAFTYLTLCELSRLAGDEGMINMAFCLSNYDSRDKLVGDDNGISIKSILTSVGLMMIMKDGICAKNESQDDIYNEIIFKENSKHENENLFSLGYMHLEKVPDAIEYVIYKSALERYKNSSGKINFEAALGRLELSEKSFESISSDVIGKPFINRDILLSMVKDKKASDSELNYKSRGEIIKDVFGNNLDLFFDLNNKADYKKRMDIELGRRVQNIKLTLENLFLNDHYTIYDINTLLLAIVKFMTENIFKNLDTNSDSLKRLEEWMSGKEKTTGRFETIKETQEPAVFYKMADEYMNLKLKELQYEIHSKAFERLLEEVRNLSLHYTNLVMVIDSAQEELEDGLASILEGELELQGGNYKDYYSAMAETILDRNRNSFRDFIQKLNEDICSGQYEEEHFFDRIITYCNENILTDKCFNDDFSEEMLKRLKDYKQMYSYEDIYNMAYNTILDNQTFFMNFITTGAINNEICFFVNTASRFVENINSRVQELKARNKIKIFYEDHFEGVDILFMEGCFCIQKIHGFTAMEQSCQGLQKSYAQ